MIRNGLALLIALGLSVSAWAGELDGERPGKLASTTATIHAGGDALGVSSGREMDRESPAQACLFGGGGYSSGYYSGYYAPAYSSAYYAPAYSSAYYAPAYTSAYYAPSYTSSYYSGYYAPAYASNYYAGYAPAYSSYYSGYSPWYRSGYYGW